MNIMEEAAETLEKAADKLENGIWGQGQERDSLVRRGEIVHAYCAVGVIKAVLFETHYNVDWAMAAKINDYATEALADYIIREWHYEPSDYIKRKVVIEWNDDRARRKSDVVDGFKHAAKDLRNKL